MTTTLTQAETTSAPVHTPIVDNYAGGSTDTTAYGHHSNTGYQNGVNTIQMEPGNMAHAQSEPQGTGIKEDG